MLVWGNTGCAVFANVFLAVVSLIVALGGGKESGAAWFGVALFTLIALACSAAKKNREEAAEQIIRNAYEQGSRDAYQSFTPQPPHSDEPRAVSNDDDEFYSTAGNEVASRNMSPGLMARALAEADGDEKKAAARYIRFRVEQLKQERARRAAAEAKKNEAEEIRKRREKEAVDLNRIWGAFAIKCRSCSITCWADPSQIGGFIHCPNCGNAVFVQKVQDNSG